LRTLVEDFIKESNARQVSWEALLALNLGSKKGGIMFKKNILVLFLAILILALFLETGWAKGVVRRTEYGKVKGFIDWPTSMAWLGIPFAKPPSGDLRWRAPQDPDPWKGVLKTEEFCSACTQMGSLIGYPDPETFGAPIGEEDCLKLNIWRPLSHKENLPVLFWIHGGANVRSHAGDPLFHGAKLAVETGIVVVTVNYRLGVMGWFTHPALRTGDPLDDSGNYGTLDLIKALRFVQKNIAEFGGDPDNVTIAGQSAGGINIYSLMVSPHARGLFHKAVIMSGGLLTTPVQKGEEHADALICSLLIKDGYATTVTEAHNVMASWGNEGVADYMRSKGAGELWAQVNKMPKKATPILTDGYVVPSNPPACFAMDNFQNVPVMLGNTLEEFKLFLYPLYKVSDKEIFHLTYEVFDPNEPNLTASDFIPDLYLPHYQDIASIGSRLFEAYFTDSMAGLLCTKQDKVFVYRFLWKQQPEPIDFIYGAAHAMEITYFFGIWDESLFSCGWSHANEKGRKALSRIMMESLANFVRTGDPNIKRRPYVWGKCWHWPPIMWEKWSNAPSSPKRLLLDADEKHPLISMSPEKNEIHALMAELSTSDPIVQGVVNAVLSGF